MDDGMFELSVERFIDAPPAAVFRTWSARLAQWWTPPPWTTEVVALDLRPGGRSAIVMHGPDGTRNAMEGVFLEVVEDRAIVFSNAFTAGWVPQAPFMVALFTFEADGRGTRYRAAARHWDAAAMEVHRAMGFETGWAMAAAQLAAIVEAERRA